jgi:DNA polymerase-3 subunit epsilon
VLDLETTGLDPKVHEIISFATVHVDQGRVRLDDAGYQFVRPHRMPNRETILIHGLREADLADAPPLADVLDGLLDALAGKALVAHVATIEERFLGAALDEGGITLINPIVDTATLAAELFRLRGQGAAPLELARLANALGLPSHRPHEADGDALTTAQVFLALATHLDAFSPQTVGSLAELRGRGQPGSRLRRVRRRLATAFARKR